MNQTTSLQDTILIVDDLPDNISVLFRLLKNKGFKVLVANSGKQALQTLEFTTPDLILLDVMMPEMDGFEVCKRLKSQEKNQAIPVLFMTALADTVNKIKGFTLGAADYITKPIQQEELLARINAHLKIHKLQLQLQRQNTQLQQQALDLQQANQQITLLNQRLADENLRLSTELEVAHRLQKMLLPQEDELNQITCLDIASFMEPADEAGGDYYDVLQHHGQILCGMGDVTGHGLDSAILMLMVQVAIRTLVAHNETDLVKLLNTLNRVICDNVQRMKSDKNLTLVLLNYQPLMVSQPEEPETGFKNGGILCLSGQHEHIIVARTNNDIEQIDTLDLGFPIGLEANIANFVTQISVPLNPGEVVVLYTDGITEAENTDKVQYGLERLCEVVKQNRQYSAHQIQRAIIEDVRQHIGEQKMFDDITLLVLKPKIGEPTCPGTKI